MNDTRTSSHACGAGTPGTKRPYRGRAALAAGLAGACLALAAGPAGAQTPREQQLEQRVSELERLVKQLLEQQAAANGGHPVAPPVASAVQGGSAAAPTAPAAPPATPAGPPPVQSVSILPNATSGSSFLFTGFVKADALWTDTPDGEIAESTPARDYYVPGSTPVGGLDEGTDFGAHVKQTRLILGVDTPIGGKDKLQARVEVDLFGSALGNQRVTNTYGVQVRHAYVQWREWLVGQTWSNFQDVAALPESVDFIGSTDGTVFVRQPQVKWTRGGLSISAENPETSITPFRGGAQIQTDDSSIPDLTAKYTWKGAWGHFALGALARQLKYETTGAGAIDDSATGFAGTVSGKFMLGQDDLRFVLLSGNLGRYVALNFANDAVLDGAGRLDAIDGYAGFVAYRHLWTRALRTNLWFAAQRYDNDAALTGGSANKGSRSWAVNLIYSPLPKLDVGAEFRAATRELESGAEGDLRRLQFTTKYSF